MTKETLNLADDLAAEIKRNQKLIEQYQSLRNMPGVNTLFAELAIKEDLNFAIDAQASQDVRQMMQAYERLRGNE